MDNRSGGGVIQTIFGIVIFALAVATVGLFVGLVRALVTAYLAHAGHPLFRVTALGAAAALVLAFVLLLLPGTGTAPAWIAGLAAVGFASIVLVGDAVLGSSSSSEIDINGTIGPWWP